jgi:hypothetical protein
MIKKGKAVVCTAIFLVESVFLLGFASGCKSTREYTEYIDVFHIGDYV